MSLVFIKGENVFCDIRAEVDETHVNIKIKIEYDRLQIRCYERETIKGTAREQKAKEVYTLRTF